MIRPAMIKDVDRILDIYAYYVENTAVTYTDKAPSREVIGSMIAERRYPFLVLEENGSIKGYTYASAFVDHEAFSHCCTLTVYMDHNARRRGYGRLLYEAIEHRLKDMGITNLYACLGDPVNDNDPYLTRDSERFHRRLGFSKVGTLHQCGRKFGRLYNMVWMEKIL